MFLSSAGLVLVSAGKESTPPTPLRHDWILPLLTACVYFDRVNISPSFKTQQLSINASPSSSLPTILNNGLERNIFSHQHNQAE